MMMMINRTIVINAVTMTMG